jgi:hypothetical protein
MPFWLDFEVFIAPQALSYDIGSFFDSAVGMVNFQTLLEGYLAQLSGG